MRERPQSINGINVHGALESDWHAKTLSTSWGSMFSRELSLRRVRWTRIRISKGGSSATGGFTGERADDCDPVLFSPSAPMPTSGNIAERKVYVKC